MATYKLSYFNLKGRAEVCRLLFALAGREYEDNRIPRENWPEIKPSTPLGQVPVMTIDGEDYPQSGALERYLAREFGFYGKNNLENTKCDVILETINDVRPELRKFSTEKDENIKEELRKNLEEVILPRFVTFIEKMLIKNGGENLVGDTVTVADLAVLHVSEQLWERTGTDMFKKSSTLKAHIDKIRAIPAIHDWLETRPKTEM